MNPEKRSIEHGIKAAKLGLAVNIMLVGLKLAAGLIGHSYALVADAIESSTDIFASIVVWSGLRITQKPADDAYQFGYGRAETIAAAVVSFMLFGAAFGIAVAAIKEIVTPHHLPAPFTLAVIPIVIVIKEILFRRVLRIGNETGSTAVSADAWHHRSDAITSAAAFLGISIALWGGEGWQAADDYAALVASVVIAINGGLMLKSVTHDLMDRVPEPGLTEQVASIALAQKNVLAVEKIRIRKQGTEYSADLHVQTDPLMSVKDAHILSGIVKSAIRTAIPKIQAVLIHIEPHEPDKTTLP